MKYIYNEPYFYVSTDKGYRKLELYLPAGSGTYGEPLEFTKRRWLRDLNELDGYIRRSKPLAGKYILKIKTAFDNRHYYDFIDGVFTKRTTQAKHAI